MNANLNDALKNGGIFPVDGSDASTRVEDGDSLNGLEPDSNARDVAVGRHIELYQASNELIVGLRRPLMSLGERSIRRVEEDRILEQMELELAGLE